MDTDALRRLHYAAAIACGVFAALAMHILLTVLGYSLDSVLRNPALELTSAIAWWAIAASGFAAGWAAGAWLIAAAREREMIYKLARRFLIVLFFGMATAAGIMSKSGDAGGTIAVIAGLTALGLGALGAYCGARLAYLNAEQM